MNRVIKELSIKQSKVCLGDELFYKGSATEISTFFKELYKHLGMKYGKFFKMDNLSKLGLLAVEILLQGLETKVKNSENIALIFANASSSLNTDKKYQDSIAEIPSPAVFVYTLPNIVMGEISIKYKLYGEHIFFIQQKYDKNVLLDYAETLFATTQTNLTLLGWLEVTTSGEYEAELILVGNEI